MLFLGWVHFKLNEIIYQRLAKDVNVKEVIANGAYRTKGCCASLRTGTGAYSGSGINGLSVCKSVCHQSLVRLCTVTTQASATGFAELQTLVGENEILAFGIDQGFPAPGQFAEEYLLGEHIANLFQNEPAEGPGPEVGIISLPGKQ